ncbi:MAG: hypothetical protein GF392_06210, partial [Candidatus Omnitrophica bacterium]|nr:hypothetical protein [Candidatus Omnitrophota bacterium]
MPGIKKTSMSVLPADLPEFARDVRDILIYAAGKLSAGKGRLALALFLKGGAFLLGLLIVYITKLTIDGGILAADLGAFMRYTGLGLLSFLLARTLTYFSDSIGEKAKADFSMDVNRDMTGRFFAMDYLSFKSLSSSENSFLFQYDQNSMENLVFVELAALTSFLKVPVCLVMGFMISPLLTALAVAALPFVGAQTLWASKKRKVLRGRELYLTRKHYSALHDAFLNFKLIKSMGKENWAGESIVKTFRGKTTGALKSGLFSIKVRTISGVVSRLATALYWIAGGYLIIREGLSFGSFSAVSIYAGMLLSETVNVGAFVEGLYSERASLKRCASFARDMIRFFRDARGEASADVPDVPDVVFDEVGFSYPGRVPVIDKACFSVPGE